MRIAAPHTPLAGEAVQVGELSCRKVKLPISGLGSDGKIHTIRTAQELISSTRLRATAEDGSVTYSPYSHADLTVLNGPRRLDAPAILSGEQTFLVPEDLVLAPVDSWDLMAELELAPIHTDEFSVANASTTRKNSILNFDPSSGRLLNIPIEHSNSTTTIWANPITIHASGSSALADNFAAMLNLQPINPGGPIQFGVADADLPRLREVLGLNADGSIPQGGLQGGGAHAEIFRELLSRVDNKTIDQVKNYTKESKRSKVGFEAAVAFRLTGDEKYRDLAFAALESISEPMALNENSFLDELISRVENPTENWGNYVDASRTLQKHAMTYSLLRPHLSDVDAKRGRRRIVQMARLFNEVTPYRYPNNHVARHGAALGTCALALWNEPSLQEEVKTWMNTAFYGLSLGMNHLGEDGVNEEGGVYAAYMNQAVFSFLRQALDADQASHLFREPRLRAYLQYMCRFYHEGVGIQSYDDGIASNRTYLPLLLSKANPEAPLIKRTFGDLSGLSPDAQGEALFFADPLNEIVPATAAELGQKNFFYEDGGIALFNSDTNIPGRKRWRLALVGESHMAHGHEKANRGTFLIAVENVNGSQTVSYVPGGVYDNAYSEGSLAPASNAPQNDFGGPFNEEGQEPMEGSFGADGLAMSGVTNKIEDTVQTRKVAWVRDGHYALMVDWSISDAQRESSFQFHGAGRAVPGGFELEDGTLLNFIPVADHAIESINPLGHDASGHAMERRHEILKRSSVGKRTSFFTIIAPESGQPLDTRRLLHDGQEVGAALVADDGSGEDWILRSQRGEETVYEDVRFQGVGALITGTAGDPPASASLFHGKLLEVKDLRFEASTEVDLAFVMDEDVQRKGFQGEVTGPDEAWTLRLDVGFPVNSAVFNGQNMKPERQDDGSYLLRLKGSGELSFGAASTIPVLVDGAEPLASSVDAMDTRSVREASTMKYLASMKTQEEFQIAFDSLTPAERQRLTYEIASKVVPEVYDVVVEKVAKVFGLPANDLDALVGTLLYWGAFGGAFPLAFGVENVSDDGSRVMGAQGSANLLKDNKITSAKLYARTDNNSHASLEYRDDTDSAGGWSGEGTGYDTGSSVNFSGGMDLNNGMHLETVATHSENADLEEGSFGFNLNKGTDGGGLYARHRNGEFLSSSINVYKNRFHMRLDSDALSNSHKFSGSYDRMTFGYEDIDGNIKARFGAGQYNKNLGVYTHFQGALLKNADGTNGYEGQASFAGNRCFLRGGFVRNGEDKSFNLSGSVLTDHGRIGAQAKINNGNVLWRGILDTGHESFMVELDDGALREIGFSCRRQILNGQLRLNASAEFAENTDPLYGLKTEYSFKGKNDSAVKLSLGAGSHDFKKLDRIEVGLVFSLGS